MPTQSPVTVTLSELEQSSITFDTLEEAFGPESLGILIVKGLPSEYVWLRENVLSSASYLAGLPEKELDRLTSPQSNYLVGWSHGKESLKTGHPDTLKGSYYINCAPFYLPSSYSSSSYSSSSSSSSATSTPFTINHDDNNENNNNYLLPTPWPPLPGFRENVERLCTLIINVAALVARQCDRYAYVHCNNNNNNNNSSSSSDDVDNDGRGYDEGFLERCVRESNTTKARLLHYFPPPAPLDEEDGEEKDDNDHDDNNDDDEDDAWCTTHVDHGCLTGLTSALYVDESEYPPIISPAPITSNSDRKTYPTTKPTMTEHSLPVLPATTPPSETTGLYIHSRTSTVIKISIPEDSLAFQTGEALELITGGRFRAVPHFVRVGGAGRRRSRTEGKGEERQRKVARNTLAVFTQPGLEVVVDKKKGLKFGEFSEEVVARFG